MASKFLDNLKNKLHNVDNKAHEMKGRMEQKQKDVNSDIEANDTF